MNNKRYSYTETVYAAGEGLFPFTCVVGVEVIANHEAFSSLAAIFFAAVSHICASLSYSVSYCVKFIDPTLLMKQENQLLCK